MHKRLATLALLVAFSFVAFPAKAQLQFLALGAFDLDWEGLALGAGVELPIEIDALPTSRTAIRPSAEYVFAGIGDRGDYSVFRISGELVGDLDLGGSSAFSNVGSQNGEGLNPFVKVGLALERFKFSWDNNVPIVGGSSFTNSEIGLVLGGGLNFGNFLVEGTLGIGNISVLRIGGGYRFGG